MGKRDDGADYWKQDAGSGISYSLNKDTPSTLYWNLVNENGNTIPEVNERKENRWWIYKLPPTISLLRSMRKRWNGKYRIRESWRL